MIVWGGINGIDLNTGGRYDPGTDSWTATNTTNAPDARESHTAVWANTTNQMIVWGGFRPAPFQHRREILRPIRCDTDTYSNSYCHTYSHSDANSDTDSYGE